MRALAFPIPFAPLGSCRVAWDPTMTAKQASPSRKQQSTRRRRIRRAACVIFHRRCCCFCCCCCCFSCCWNTPAKQYALLARDPHCPRPYYQHGPEEDPPTFRGDVPVRCCHDFALFPRVDVAPTAATVVVFGVVDGVLVAVVGEVSLVPANLVGGVRGPCSEAYYEVPMDQHLAAEVLPRRC